MSMDVDFFLTFSGCHVSGITIFTSLALETRQPINFVDFAMTVKIVNGNTFQIKS